MARHSGKNLKVKVGAAFIDGVMGFDFTETRDTHEITAAGDGWKDFDIGLNGFTGSITMRLDHVATGQDLRAGAVVAFAGYTEGAARGTTYISGSCIVSQHQLDVRYDGVAGRQYSVTGKGALTVAVAP